MKQVHSAKENYLAISDQQIPATEAIGPVDPEFKVDIRQPVERFYTRRTEPLKLPEHNVRYPFSNDDTVVVYESLRARTHMPEFTRPERTAAVLVGEGSLIASLAHDLIPEKTIALIDSSLGMNRFTEDMLQALLRAKSRKEFLTVTTKQAAQAIISLRFETQLQKQLRIWNSSGLEHPLSQGADELFLKAQERAKRKKFIVANVDLFERSSMERLSTVLRSRNEIITFINITNVYQYCGYGENRDSTRQDFVGGMRLLPLAHGVPIVSTSVSANLHTFEGKIYSIADEGTPPTGPFFGLYNFEHSLKGGASSVMSMGKVCIVGMGSDT